MESHKIKSVNTDKRVKNRFRFTSSKQRAKHASADVYRSYKRRIGVTSAASREERVHHPHREESTRSIKRQRTAYKKSDGGQKAVIRDGEVEGTTAPSGVEAVDLEAAGASFSEELDLAMDRNASEVFGKFHREIWPLARSLPEVIHHCSKIIDIILAYMLSNASEPGEKSTGFGTISGKRDRFVINHATTEILHLLGVLARDLRHEIHPYLHSKIMPRIVLDLLNPPLTTVEESEKQSLPLDVSIIEAAFRTLSYIFRYDTDQLIVEVDKAGNDPCLEKLRQYYGSTLAHRRDVARRLAAETFAPLVRKLKQDSSRRRHLRRVIRALSASQKQDVTSSSALKLQTNAVDGISHFFFEVARGVAGQLNSKGRVAVKVLLDALCDDTKDTLSPKARELVHSVTSSFLEKVCQHLDRHYFGDLLEEIVATTERVLRAVEGRNLASKQDDFNFGPQEYVMRLLNQLAQFRDGFLLNGHNDEYKFKSRGDLKKIIVRVFDVMVPVFPELPERVQTAALTLLCSTWKAIPDDAHFAKLIRGHIGSIVHCHTSASSIEDAEKQRHPAHFLAEELMPFLPASVAMGAVGTSILSAAADLADENIELSLSLILSVVNISTGVENGDENEELEDALYSLDNSSDCVISLGLKKKLLNICLLSYELKEASHLEVCQLGIAARCAPFLALTGWKGEEEEDNDDDDDDNDHKMSLTSCIKMVSKWLVQLSLACSETVIRDPAQGDTFALTACLALESLSRLSIEAFQRIDTAEWVSKSLSRVKSSVERLMLSRPASHWILKSISVYVKALQLFNLTLEERDAIFDAVIPNLRSPSHFRRLYSLVILTSFPKKPFVTDHADLDLTDDLDEEAGEFPKNEPVKGAVVRAGLCDILDTLVSIETTAIELENERLLQSLVSRVEVLGRTARLPVVYTEAAANHMLGILYIKFAPIWKFAVRAFIALANAQVDFVWSPLKEQISMLMNHFPAVEETKQDISTLESSTSESSFYHMRCWDNSNGTDLRVFGRETSGRLPTDEATVLEAVLSVLEGAQQLLMKNNREFVPIFLQFMHSQFYSHYLHDPDARELRIEDHIEGTSRVDRHLLHAHTVKRRLTSMLKVFSAVKGPKQLYKYGVLFSIFRSLLSFQESTISQLAFSCIQTYKLPYITPFAERFENLFAKGALREGLLKFTTALESSQIDHDQRQQLIPILMRVLFGRLSARAASRSPKDSPAARRAAVLSFISTVCKSEEELYPFIYLMIRSYVPSNYMLNPVEEQKAATRDGVLQIVQTVDVPGLESLPTQVHIGFLHLLEPVIAHLGHRATNFVDQVFYIVTTLCRMAQIKKPSTPGTVEGDVAEEVEEGDSTSKEFGSIRTLCFRRLSEIFHQFSETVDFEKHAKAMWDSIKLSVDMLPATVVNCDKAPASLSLMVTLSNHSKLIPLLFQYQEAAPCVIKCLADTSPFSVVDATLRFINQLLSDEATKSSKSGQQLISRQVDLILHQFLLKLGKKKILQPSDTVGLEITEKSGNNKAQTRSTTWRRELDILCRISQLIEEEGSTLNTVSEKDDVAEKLCTLLIPFLEQSKGVTELDQLNILKVIEVLIPKVNYAKGSVHYEQFAQLLGPAKARPGIVSIPVRQAISSVIGKIANEMNLAAVRISGIVGDLCKSHRKRVDEMDYDCVIPALNSLSEDESDSSWLSLTRLIEENTEDCDAKLLLPIVFTCFQYLFDDDGVVSRTAFKSLKSLIVLVAKEAGLLQSDKPKEETSACSQWLVLLERFIVPVVRGGLGTRDPAVRRLYILLIAEVARFCKNSPKANLYGDLSVLIRDDDQDLDFFLNITHVQIHRRTRAYQRLRKLLSEDTEGNAGSCFSLQSLSNVLLPIALHPIYESKTKAEENFAIEAVATVGAISRHLSWSKYNNLLWTNLTQFHRHPEQERYLVAMICAVIDGFHFDISSADSGNDANGSGSAVWRALERRFIPKIEGLLTREKVDKHGSKTKTLRASVVLALVKLFKKFSKETFEMKLPRLLTVICDSLKSRESDSRDVARDTLAKVVVEIDMSYLPDVLRELAIALHEGFRLHVRIATIHSILLALSKHYTPLKDISNEDVAALPFDRSVPAFMDLIQQDLFGNAQERRDAEGVQGRYVKEAAGSKSHNALELIATLIVFRPSSAKESKGSGIHFLVSPLIERLQMPTVDAITIRRVKECLSRVVTGVARNPTVKLEEVFPFVYATAAPFIGQKDISGLFESQEDEMCSDDDEPMKPLHVSGSAIDSSQLEGASKPKLKDGKVADWRPSTLKSPKTSKAAASASLRDTQNLRKVQDGAAAPKLTGSSRFTAVLAATSRINDPSNIGAVVFSLRLLYSVLKKNKPRSSDSSLVALIDPFVPLLTACICASRETDIVLLSLRCLGLFLYLDLPSKEKCTTALGSKTLELLSSSGVGSNEDNELSQSCFKMLTILMNIDQNRSNGDNSTILDGEQALTRSSTMPLDSEQMKVLISFLQEAITDSENHNAALNLLKAIMSHRFVSPEFYDLMETIIEQSVRSHKAALRQQSTGVAINYLLNYPMGTERFEQHLKQIIVNIKYEREDGRLSAINLAAMIVDKLPVPELEKQVQLFFLPLTLQLVNDDSKKCREAVACCLTNLLSRVSTDVVQNLYDFACRWSQGEGEVQRCSLQLFGFFVDAREDFIKRGDTATELLERLKNIILTSSIEESEWEIYYFSLICLEKLTKPFPKLLASESDLWKAITDCLAHPHPFVKLVSSRLINQHLESMDPLDFAEKHPKTFLLEKPGSLYEIARNLCFQLNADEGQQNDEITALCIKSLCWLLPAMQKYPELCVSSEVTAADKSTDNPVGWVMKRLSSIAKPKGPKRRQAVFKAFAAFATKCPKVAFQHLELMLEPLHRVDTETVNDVEKPSLTSRSSRGLQPKGGGEAIPEEAVMARDVLHLLEEKSDPPEEFLRAYALIKTRARERKESRKLLIKSEAVRDPQAAAKRRQQNNEKEKKRRKRRVEDRRRERGATAKRSRYLD